MNKALLLLAILALLFASALAQDGKAPEGDKKAADCEVCIGLLTRFEEKVKADNIKDIEKIESMMLKECKAVTHPREKRLCWYLGAAKDSATNIMREVSKPLAMGMPASAICPRRLKQKDAAICGLRYEGSSVVEEPPQDAKKPNKPKPKPKPKIDFAGLQKMKIKELKEILTKYSLDCDGCTEKGDYVRRIKTLQPKEEL